MIITPVAHHLEEVLAKTDGPRSAGLHVSDLYNSIYQTLDPARYARGDDAEHSGLYYRCLGTAFEQYLEPKLRQAGLDAHRPPECRTPEGIYYSPDLLIYNGETRMGEIKLTWKSESEALGEPKFQKWLTQKMVYGHHLGINLGRVYAMFVNGDYRRRREPMLRAYDVEFSAREMREEWQMLVNHGRHTGLL